MALVASPLLPTSCGRGPTRLIFPYRTKNSSGQLIQGKPADKLSNARDARIIGEFHHRTALPEIFLLINKVSIESQLVGVLDHRTELEISKGLP